MLRRGCLYELEARFSVGRLAGKRGQFSFMMYKERVMRRIVYFRGIF